MDITEIMNVPEPDGRDDVRSAAKAVAGLFPTGGDIFDFLVPSSHANRMQKWRRGIVAVIFQLKERNDNIVQELKDNQEFISLLSSATISSAKTHQLEKLECLQNGLFNSLSGVRDYDTNQVFMNLLMR